MEMYAEKTRKKEKKPTLAGRVSTHKRYLAEGRLEKNRAQRAAKQQKRLAEQACKVLKAARGTAKALRWAEMRATEELLIQKNIERVLASLERVLANPNRTS